MLRRATIAASLWLVPAMASAAELDTRNIEIDESGAHSAGVRLTLVPALQREAQRLLVQARAPAGAIVMADVKDGRLLVWASRGSGVDLVLTPMFPPASLLKVVTAAALLEDGHVFRSTPLCYSGGMRDLEWQDVASLCRPGEARLPFGEALGRSINVVFGRLAVAHLSPHRWIDAAQALGLAATPNIDVSAPPSLVREPQNPLGLARSAAGFVRDARVSPLSVMAMMHTIANGGAQVKLQLRDEGAVERVVVGRPLRSSTARALTHMLEVTTKHGTARHSFKGSGAVAGKTGTLGLGPRTLSWFAGFAPAHKPEVAIAVMLTNDPRWWRKAHELARELLDVARNVDVPLRPR
ncbi:MAG TPA: penicillin-binding transpeptidase domain-containing protein [Polyangiaceae bacterium]|jgi:cell division protein FtsI/penicillin-binding protein 2|nr:penicillin-binding transpeptidase domain-containing protein [Polyangiaceae bacterium]